MKYSEFIEKVNYCKKTPYPGAIPNKYLGTKKGEACAKRSSSSAGGD